MTPVRPSWPASRWAPALLAAAALAASFVLHPERGGPTLCLSRLLSGYSCPGCGLTRSWCALSHGRWAESIVFHPMGPPLYLIAVGTLVAALLGWTAGGHPPIRLSDSALQGLGIGVGLVWLVWSFTRFGYEAGWL